MAYKTIKCVSVPKLKSFGPTKTELKAKEVGEFSIMLYGKMSWETFSCPASWLPQYKCMEIFSCMEIISCRSGSSLALLFSSTSDNWSIAWTGSLMKFSRSS